MNKENVTLNGTTYQWPSKPVVVVCIDGCDPTYIERGIRDGIIPNIERFTKEGLYTIANGTVPSFTCPNNMSIVTGSPPAVHGISGNYYLEPETREAVMMTGPELLRSSTLLSEFSKAGARTVSITSKDKLRQQLQKGVNVAAGNISFSAQYADQCTLTENGIEDPLALTGMPQPHMYSTELSMFVMEAGIQLLKQRRPDILYLSLTDYVQHKFAAGEQEANEFYKDLDDACGRLAELDAVVAVVADHGMNDKSKDDGSPNVIWLQDLLDGEFGKDSTTVICPVTDPFVAHHGALGGFVRVYCNDGATTEDVIRFTERLPGVESVYDRVSVSAEFELPPDREGDVAVIGDAGTCIGAAETAHDLRGLKGHRLRTHGGVSERRVPFIISEPINDEYQSRSARRTLKSHEIFEFAINGTKG
ncbi:MAG: phosphonoacetate hydrolase [Acidiferrobacterales bacterium]